MTQTLLATQAASCGAYVQHPADDLLIRACAARGNSASDVADVGTVQIQTDTLGQVMNVVFSQTCIRAGGTYLSAGVSLLMHLIRASFVFPRTSGWVAIISWACMLVSCSTGPISVRKSICSFQFPSCWLPRGRSSLRAAAYWPLRESQAITRRLPLPDVGSAIVAVHRWFLSTKAVQKSG
jgi:hypothetical protein